MYLDHFGLREFPFSLTPDTHFFFEYGHYRDAFDTLVVALGGGEGFIKVTGEVGTGKTLLCRKLLNSLDQDAFYTAYIPNPYLTPPALGLALAEELGLELARNVGQHRAVKEVTRRLIQLHAEGKQVVLLIDEAQAMPGETLEALRLLTNLETEKRKLLQVVLFGQPELDEHLSERANRQLRQRITFSYRLPPIDRQGMEAYVSHRLLVAGSSGNVHFAPDALDALHHYSRGIPRLVNILSHKALMAGYGQGVRDVAVQHVEMAAQDTEDVQRSTDTHRQGLLIALALAAVVVLAVLAWWLGQPWFAEPVQP
jgi:MSHA biogenesis protein MshM